MELPGFELLDKLGEGGMATVWRARQVTLDRIVAIKVMSSHLSHGEEDTQRFVSEAQSTAKLNHPGIIQVYDANVHDGIYYFVMEYVDGYSVGDWIRRKKIIDEEGAMLTAEHVVHGLKYAWDSQRLIHCDIKPDNVMIDSNGTIKIADLGLARSIGTESGRNSQFEEEVVGTPNFMSPEQVRGDPNLDCRTDMYSLGAMLYHMLTGEMPFHDLDDMTVMDRQASGTIPDPLDLNPKLSMAACWLIEKMLAKRREDRHADWDAVLTDIARTQHKTTLKGEELPPNASTVERSTKRTRPHSRYHVLSTQEKKRTSPLLWILIGTVLIGLAVALIAALSSNRSSRPEPGGRSAPQPIATQPAATERSEQQAGELYEQATAHVDAHPDDYVGAIERLRTVVTRHPNSHYAKLAKQLAREVRNAMQAAAKDALGQLQTRADALLAENQFKEAIAIYNEYAGPLARATASARMDAQHNIRKRAATFEAEQRAATQEREARVKELMATVVTEILTSDNITAARMKLIAAMKNPDFRDGKRDLDAAESQIGALVSLDQRILRTFLAEKGRTITFSTVDGDVTFEVASAADGVIVGAQKVKKGTYSFSKSVSVPITALTMAEVVKRVGAEAVGTVALRLGIASYKAERIDKACAQFAKAPPPLGPHLLAHSRADQRQRREAAAVPAMKSLLRSAGVTVGEYDKSKWLQAISEKEQQGGTSRSLTPAINTYRSTHGETEFATDNDDILGALATLEKKAEAVERDDPKLKEGVAAQKHPIVALLLRDNPEMLPSEITVKVDADGEVRHLTIVSPGARNIDAVRQLSKLQHFSCGSLQPGQHRSSQTPEAELSDVAALKGLPLRYLCLRMTSVRDLSPLSGMQLEQLCISDTAVSDLSALRGMPLLELDISNTSVSSASPLKGMPLTVLKASHTRLSDCRDLAGMPLSHLELGSTQVNDIRPLAGMQLKHLDLEGSRAFNFAPLQGMPLRYLNLKDTQIADVSFLAKTPIQDLNLQDTRVGDISKIPMRNLKVLSLSGTLVKDFSPLAKATLTRLSLKDCRLKDLSCLRRVGKLQDLDISDTGVSDLMPIAKSALRSLRMCNTSVKDLRPISQLPLVILDCRNIRTKDYRALSRMPVQYLLIDNPDLVEPAILRSMPNLKSVNGKQWKRWQGPRAPQPKQRPRARR